MIFRNTRCKFVPYTMLLIFTILLAACGGSDPKTSVVGGPPPDDLSETAAEALGDEEDAAGEEMGMDISGMVNQELPPGFPSDFPIPPNAQVSSTISLGADDEFRVYFAILDTLEKTIVFYESELPPAGWTIGEQKETASVYQFEIESPTYVGELLLVGAETGVALEVHLMPLEVSGEQLDIDSILGDTTPLGDNASGLPSDLPLPTSFTAIDLPPSLNVEGYAAAFHFGGIAEMALLDFNIAMFTSGWLIEDANEGDNPRSFVIQFSNPSTSFQGYALVTDNLTQLGVTGIEGTLIALHEGVP